MLIISDFSKTFTRSDMPTTWSVFAKSEMLGDEYFTDRDNLYNEYFQFEQEGNIQKTELWFSKHAELFTKYHLTQDQIDQIVMDDRFFAPRPWVRELLDYITQQDIPLIIVTSWITNIVSAWFQKRYNYIPEVIFWNELIMDDGVVVWVEQDSITCPLDKSIDIEGEHDGVSIEDIILIGDNIEDTRIIQNPKLTLGFTDEERGFDIKLGKEGTMSDTIEYLK